MSPWNPFNPFKVGDRIHRIRCLGYAWTSSERGSGRVDDEMDDRESDAIVTEITPDGFRYEYDNPACADWDVMGWRGECGGEQLRFWKRLPQ